MINASNERVWVKFHFRSEQGVENLTDAEAEALVGRDRESHQRDLFESIETGRFPRWTLFIQVMTEAQARSHPHNPFDLTKVWPHADYPLIEVGVLTLDKNPRTSSPRSSRRRSRRQRRPWNRVFAGLDAAGTSLLLRGRATLPPRGQLQSDSGECAEVPFHSYHRDGAMRVDGNLGRTTPYFPNSDGQWDDSPSAGEPPLALDGDAGSWDHLNRRRSSGAAGTTLSPDDSGAEASPLRQHRAKHRERQHRNEAAPHRELHEGRPGLWRRRGSGHGPCHGFRSRFAPNGADVATYAAGSR